MKYFVTTQRGKERIAASYIEEMGAEARPRPGGYYGVVLVEGDVEEESLLAIPEVEKVFPVEVECSSEFEEMCTRVASLHTRLPEGASFGIYAVRRGKKDYTSMDIGRVAGAKILEARPDLKVDLTSPDFWVVVQVVDDRCYAGVVPGDVFHRKYLGKGDSRKLTGKLSIVQMAYLSDDPQACRRMGEAAGRAAQAFEVRELIIAIHEPYPLRALKAYLVGVEVGVKSRFEQQRATYGREVHEVPVRVYELYQMIRSLHPKKDLVMITDPRGKPLREVEAELREDLMRAERIYVFHGAHTGIPPGTFRFAHYVVDLAPGITYATEQAIPVSIVALINLYECPL